MQDTHCDKQLVMSIHILYDLGLRKYFTYSFNMRDGCKICSFEPRIFLLRAMKIGENGTDSHTNNNIFIFFKRTKKNKTKKLNKNEQKNYLSFERKKKKIERKWREKIVFVFFRKSIAIGCLYVFI